MGKAGAPRRSTRFSVLLGRKACYLPSESSFFYGFLPLSTSGGWRRPGGETARGRATRPRPPPPNIIMYYAGGS